LLEVSDLVVGLQRSGEVIRIRDGVSFHIDSGETLGIVGESGCGKTTAGLSILRLTPRASHPHTTGRILFDGRDVMAMTDAELYRFRGRDVSMILQDPMTSLDPVFTIGDQVAETIRAHRLADGDTVGAQVIDALRLVRIPAPEQRTSAYPHQISGGMKQRVVGAIAIACRPRLLIADEPTTALDVTIQAQYLQLLQDLQREFNMALMFITHDFGVVAKMCDRVCVMYAGQVVETAKVRDIFRAPAHWYTAALIGGIPKLGCKPDTLTAIPGAPPAPGHAPDGCRFAPRCRNVRDRCRDEPPPLTDLDGRHQVRCWFPRDPANPDGEQLA